MADYPYRINLEVGSTGGSLAVTEQGTPWIFSDNGYRFGWLAGGSWRFAALRGGDESFSGVTITGLSANVVPKLNASKKLVASAFSDDGSDAACSLNLVVPSISLNGRKIKQPSYCGMYAAAPAAVQSIPTGSTYTKITPFDTNQVGEGSTPDHANDQITVDRDGTYRVSFSRSYQVGTVNVNWHIAVLKKSIGESTWTPMPSSVQEVYTTNVTQNYASQCSHVVLAAGDIVAIGVYHGAGAAVNLTYLHAALMIEAID